MLASTSLRRGQRRHLETCSTGESAQRLAALVDFAQHGDPRHGTVTRITGGSLHNTESGTARRFKALVDVERHGDSHHWWIAARHGARHGTETASLVDHCTTWSPARHGDSKRWWTSHGTVTGITGGSLHGTESGTARRPAAQVYGTVFAVGRYNWRAGGRLSHGTGLCTVYVLARHYSARYLAPCKTVTLDIASHRTSRAALRDFTQSVLAFY